MHILTTSTDIQGFKVIPRGFPTNVNILLTDAETNVTASFINTPTYEYGSMIISESFELSENHFYILNISADGDDIYKGRIFCTNQPNYEKFDITSGSFLTSDPVDNIILI